MPPFINDNVWGTVFLEDRQKFRADGSGRFQQDLLPRSQLTLRHMIGRVLLACLLLAAIPSGRAAASESELDLRSIPIAQWLNAPGAAEIPWNIRVGNPDLRMDQRLEVAYSVQIGAKQLNRTGKSHDLFLVTRISSLDGEWLNEPEILRQTIEQELPGNAAVQFNMRAFVQPGNYLVWLVLYDRTTGKHNVARRRVRVSEIDDDPLPYLSKGMPIVEFPQTRESGDGTVLMSSSRLSLPVTTKNPVDIELISTLNAPEQWVRRFRMVRNHNYITIGALAALSQMELSQGSISIAGLDLARHEVLFEQNDFRSIEWTALMDALEKAQIPEISAAALEDRKNNGAFFREFLGERIAAGSSSSERPLRVFIVVTSSLLFESGSDLRPIVLEGDCHCRVYHLRFRLSVNDVFDELERVMKPLRPRTFNLMTPRDLRKAIAAILDDLRNL